MGDGVGDARPVIIRTLFGTEESASALLQFIEKLAIELDGTTYEFMDLEPFKKLMVENWRQGNKLYWTELLYRCHWAAATSLLRSKAWFDGAMAACDADNFHSFAANVRGLIEASTDSIASLTNVPVFLAENYGTIRQAIRGKGKTAFLAEDLENHLIHFSYARKLGKDDDFPVTHKAKSAQAYLDGIRDDAGEEVKKTYAWLCNITHPSAMSVQLFCDGVNEEGVQRISLRAKNPATWIHALAVARGSSIRDCYQMATNLALLTLRVLWHFPVTVVRSPSIRDLHFADVKMWGKIQALFRRHGVLV